MLTPGIVAHGIGGVQDLPVPTWLFFWGGAVVLVVSFIALGALWRSPRLAAAAVGRALPDIIGRAVLGPVRIAVQVISVAMFALVLVSAIAGTSDAFRNLAPTWIYVVFWLGVPLLSFLFGDVWRALSPWRALADAFVWIWERSGRTAKPLAVYPERLGRYPRSVGAALLRGARALLLGPVEPARTRVRHRALLLRDSLRDGHVRTHDLDRTRGGVRDPVRLRGADGAADAATAASACAAVHGLADVELVPGSAFFLAVALGSVGFDGFGRTTTWQDLIARVEGPYVIDRPGLAEALVTAVDLAGLFLAVAFVGLAYFGACTLARSMVNAPRPLVREFVLSLVPIAFVYEVAHYFSLFVLQGQYAVPLLSDPLGKGWDLFGTAGVTPDLAVLSPNTIWYVQASALVLGHVVGLTVAHDRAVTIFRDRDDALRSQYAMLALMVLYTIGGLWLLSRV